ncbi:Chemokine-like factor [Varanus komodoensis]|uniref:chemokine-like factor isoform X2 n=1 Tax=Varanus komodoensis TaxID=61221 RepID=UPI001CF79013|nr:chemokine-like factor isoform X2 [Varanus komodoensis]KAF7242821.1 Chemokine-like factor [Varanus komodoensis]
MVEVNRAFLRSVKGALKIARMVAAFIATICFGLTNIQEAFLTLTIIELVVDSLFFLLYLLDLQKVLTWFFWPLIDAFNSLVAALFLFIVGLYAVIKKILIESLVGGVFCLILCALCVTDATLIMLKVNFNRGAPRTVSQR